MKQFSSREIRAAKTFAQLGGQALHVWTPPSGGWPGAPHCFILAAERGEDWGHLFDMDAARLQRTAQQCGVRVLVIHNAGTPNQHIDLCGSPLQRALAMSQVEVCK